MQNIYQSDSLGLELFPFFKQCQQWLPPEKYSRYAVLVCAEGTVEARQHRLECQTGLCWREVQLFPQHRGRLSGRMASPRPAKTPGDSWSSLTFFSDGRWVAGVFSENAHVLPTNESVYSFVEADCESGQWRNGLRTVCLAWTLQYFSPTSCPVWKHWAFSCLCSCFSTLLYK